MHMHHICACACGWCMCMCQTIECWLEGTRSRPGTVRHSPKSRPRCVRAPRGPVSRTPDVVPQGLALRHTRGSAREEIREEFEDGANALPGESHPYVSAPTLRLHLRRSATASAGFMSGEGEAPCNSSSSSFCRKEMSEPGGSSRSQAERTSRTSPASRTATSRSSRVDRIITGDWSAGRLLGGLWSSISTTLALAPRGRNKRFSRRRSV